MVFVGSAVRIDRGVEPYSQHVSRLHPDGEGMSSPLLGFWGYFLSPRGAKKLLRMVWREQGQDGWRHYQPVDLFVAKRNRKLGNVFIFEPPSDMKEEFERNPDRHHVIESHRQIGIVALAKGLGSLNKAAKSPEQEEMDGLLQEQVRLGDANQPLQGWRATQRSFQ